MTVTELTDLKTTINWLLENGEFKDTETSYNLAMNSINMLEEQLSIPRVSNCSGFKQDDLSKAYQAGALETYAEEIKPLTYDAIKQVEQNSLAWIKRWKE